MPIHDWSRVDAGLFHAFHQGWITALCDTLNSSALPPEYFALPEQSIPGPIPDVLALKLSEGRDEPNGQSSGATVTVAPPQTRMIRRAEDQIYVRKADRITVRHRHGDVVSVVEIVSPGNKASTSAFRTFIEKAAELIDQGIHLLVIDLFRPGKRDPKGIHNAIWDKFLEEDFELPAGLPLTLVSYDAGPPLTAYVEPVAIGDVLPDMPLFLKPGFYVPAPLEASYQTTWGRFPAPMKKLLEGPRYGPDVV